MPPDSPTITEPTTADPSPQCTQFESFLNELLDRRLELDSAFNDAHLKRCIQCQSLLSSYCLLTTGRSCCAAAKRQGLRPDFEGFYATKTLTAVVAVLAAVWMVCFCGGVQDFRQMQPSDELASVQAFSRHPNAGFTLVSTSEDELGEYQLGQIDQYGTAWNFASNISFQNLCQIADQLPVDQWERQLESSIGPSGVIGGNHLVAEFNRASELVATWPSFLGYWKFTGHLPGVRTLHHSVFATIELFNAEKPAQRLLESVDFEHDKRRLLRLTCVA